MHIKDKEMGLKILSNVSEIYLKYLLIYIDTRQKQVSTNWSDLSM